MIDLEKLRKEIQAVAAVGFFHAGVSNKEVLDLIDYAAQLEKDAGCSVSGYVCGVQTGDTVRLVFDNQDAAVQWFESFTDAIDTAMESKNG